MVTAREVAELAGVAQSTVSYVMSGTRTISQATRERVEAAMRELNYHPNASARALAGRRANVIGLVTRLSSDVTIASTTPFIETITAAAADRDYDVVLVTSDDDPATLERLARRAIVDALVIMDVRRRDPRVAAVGDLGIPAVLIGVPDETERLACVDVDAFQAGELACAELVGGGCERLLLVGEMPAAMNPEYSYISRFEEGVRHRGRQTDTTVEVVWSASSGWSGYTEVADAVLERRSAARRDGRDIGVILRTPQVIDGLGQMLALRNVFLGADLPAVALCTDSYAESLRVPITNVSPEPVEVSAVAMRSLFARLLDEEATGGVQLVEPRLTRRGTSPAGHR